MQKFLTIFWNAFLIKLRKSLFLKMLIPNNGSTFIAEKPPLKNGIVNAIINIIKNIPTTT